MKKIPKILLVGSGRFGINHLRVLKSLEKEGKIDFNGVVVRSPKKYNKIKSEFSVHVFDALSMDILKNTDAVIIVTPPETHFQIAKQCLKYCHVFIEKPVATSHKDLVEINKLIRKYKKTFIVGHIFRFNEITIKLKNLVGVSRPQKITGSFINPVVSDQGREISLEFLHLFDIVDYIWPISPEHVFSIVSERMSKVNIRYSKGCDAHFSLGWNGNEKIRNIKFVYDKKTIEADYIKNVIEIRNEKGVIIKKYEFSQLEGPLHAELSDFVKKLSSTKPVSNIDMALRVTSTALQAIPKKLRSPRVAIIGGGIFGLSVAAELGSFCNVTLFERHKQLMQEGTFINQFRHHYGYHYPRSDETVIDVQRSRADFEKIFGDALFINSPTYYAIAKEGSRVNVQEFIK